MEALGTYLRNAREARSLDLRDAAQQTRISINYLKALEDGDFTKLPGEVFVKGFLKNYARFLHLSEGEVVKRYEEGVKARQGAAAAAASASPKIKDQEQTPVKMQALNDELNQQPGGMSLEPFLWGGVVFIGIVLFLYLALPAGRSVHEQEMPVSTHVTPTDGLQTGAVGTAKAGKLYLEIIALEDAWVLVRTDASPQKKAVLKTGESITWSAEDRFLLSYASVGSLKLLLNGNELTVNGPKSAVVRDLIVTAQGIAFQKVESEQPPRPRKPKPLTQATSTAQPPVQEAPAPLPEPVIPGPPTVSPVEPPVSLRE